MLPTNLVFQLSFTMLIILIAAKMCYKKKLSKSNNVFGIKWNIQHSCYNKLQIGQFEQNPGWS